MEIETADALDEAASEAAPIIGASGRIVDEDGNVYLLSDGIARIVRPEAD